MTDPVVAAVAGRPTRRALALVFLQIGLMGFGGVLPAARKVLVDDRRWLTDQEFTELLSIGQALPGPNVVNVTTAYAARQHGAVGAVIAVSALMLAPIVIVLTLGALYLRYVQSIVHGVAPAAAGLMLAAGLKLAVSELRRPWKFVIAGAALCGVGLLRWPLYVVLPISALVSVAFAWLLLAREADRDGAK
jgi:chromate transporter